MPEELSGPSTSHQKDLFIVHFKESKKDAFTRIYQREDPESRIANQKNFVKCSCHSL